MKRSKQSIFFMVVLFTSTIAFVTTANAIPSLQKDCVTSDTEWLVVDEFQGAVLDPNISVTVQNGDVARLCIIQYSAGVTGTFSDVVIGVSFRVDNGPCRITGPTAFHQGPDIETHTNISQRLIPPGLHRITPCIVVVSDFGDGAALLENRCMVVECRTQ